MPRSPTMTPPPLERANERMTSVTDVEGGASLGTPCPDPDGPPGVSKASFGFSSAWICGGGAGPGVRPGGSLGPTSLTASTFGGSIIGGGLGLATGVGGGRRARGRVVDGRPTGACTSGRGSKDSTLNDLAIFSVLGAFCVGSFSG